MNDDDFRQRVMAYLFGEPPAPEVPQVLRRLHAEGWQGMAERYPEAGDEFLRFDRKIQGDANDEGMQASVAAAGLEFLRRWGIDPLPEVCAVVLPGNTLMVCVRDVVRPALEASREVCSRCKGSGYDPEPLSIPFEAQGACSECDGNGTPRRVDL